MFGSFTEPFNVFGINGLGGGMRSYLVPFQLFLSASVSYIIRRVALEH